MATQWTDGSPHYCVPCGMLGSWLEETAIRERPAMPGQRVRNARVAILLAAAETNATVRDHRIVTFEPQRS